MKFEARSGWVKVETIEISRIEWRGIGLTADEVGSTLAEGKELLGELARLVLQTQMEKITTCARVCHDCPKLRQEVENFWSVMPPVERSGWNSGSYSERRL